MSRFTGWTHFAVGCTWHGKVGCCWWTYGHALWFIPWNPGHLVLVIFLIITLFLTLFIRLRGICDFLRNTLLFLFFFVGIGHTNRCFTMAARLVWQWLDHIIEIHQEQISCRQMQWYHTCHVRTAQSMMMCINSCLNPSKKRIGNEEWCVPRYHCNFHMKVSHRYYQGMFATQNSLVTKTKLHLAWAPT